MKVSGIKKIEYNQDFSILNLENVYIDIDVSTEAAEITLPKISEMSQRNVKFYVNLDQNYDQNFGATIFPAEGDTINGLEEFTIEPGNKGFWILVQDTNLWSMANSQFVPVSVLGLNATIVATDGQLSVDIDGGLAPYSINWTLPQAFMRGYTISGSSTGTSITFAERPNTDPSQPSGFAPLTGPSFVLPQLVKVEVTDSLGSVSKDFYYIMAVEQD